MSDVSGWYDENQFGWLMVDLSMSDFGGSIKNISVLRFCKRNIITS